MGLDLLLYQATNRSEGVWLAAITADTPSSLSNINYNLYFAEDPPHGRCGYASQSDDVYERAGTR